MGPCFEAESEGQAMDVWPKGLRVVIKWQPRLSVIEPTTGDLTLMISLANKVVSSIFKSIGQSLF